jgi:hypothetical protein
VNGVVKWRGTVNKTMLEPGEAGDAARAAFAELAEPLHRRVYEMHGTELGYRYESPVIWPEDGEAPPDDSFIYRPGTFPGLRLPHVWLADGTALHDRMGAGFSLLRLGGTVADTGGLEHALRGAGVPLEVLTVNETAISKVFERDLILVRPDLHVAWRGNEAPEDPNLVARAVTGNYANSHGL